MLSKDHSAEFKRRFADRYADGATVAMPQRELGLTKPTARRWREGTDRGGAGAIDGPRRSDRCPQGRGSSFAPQRPASAARVTAGPSLSSTARAAARGYGTG